MTDAQMRRLQATNASFAAGIQRFDYIAATSKFSSQIEAVLNAQKVQRVSQLNSDVAYRVNKKTGAVQVIPKSPVGLFNNFGIRAKGFQPLSYLTNIAWLYWFNPANISSTWIVGNAAVGAKCALDWVGPIPIGGCVAEQVGAFVNARNSIAGYAGETLGWTSAVNLESPSVLNVGPVNYYWDALNFYISTDDIIILAIYASGTPY